MMLKSFGCSFIFGSDLSDIGLNKYYALGSYLTWPALLAKDLDMDYRTYAKPGAGNLQILERLISEIATSDPAIYVIGWSYIDRFDYIHNRQDPWPGTPWDTVLPQDTDISADMYYRHFHSQLKDKLCTLIYIKTAVDLLKQKNLPFVMTYMDDLIFETQWHATESVLELQQQIRPYLTTFEGKNFLDWSRDRGFEISSRCHPLEQAHRSAADLIQSYNLV